MSDDRIARLTELARRVWSDCSDVEVVSGPKGLMVAGDDPELARITLLHINHRNAPVPLLDALEAALLVLAGDLVLTGDERSLMRPDIEKVIHANVEVGIAYTTLVLELQKLAREWSDKAAQWMAEYRAAGEDEHSGPMEAARQQLVLAEQLRKAAQGDKP